MVDNKDMKDKEQGAYCPGGAYPVHSVAEKCPAISAPVRLRNVQGDEGGESEERDRPAPKQTQRRGVAHELRECLTPVEDKVKDVNDGENDEENEVDQESDGR